MSASSPLFLHGRLYGELYLNFHVVQFTVENCGFIFPACSIVASLFYHSLHPRLLFLFNDTLSCKDKRAFVVDE